MNNLADALARRLAQHGVKRIYGVPGGDCSLDVIDAATRHGIHFVLARNESAAAMMAMAEAQIGGAPGVIVTTRGPGLANAVNGIACASLDRVPLLVLADGHETDMTHVSHQRFDQMALLAPLVKASSAPMFTSSASLSMGRKAGMIAAKAPKTIVVIHGVRNFGCTAEAHLGSNPSRDIE